MLPSGMTLNQASKGFKNQGQFIAALHVSQNLGIPFADLKTAMTGIRPVTTTGGTTGTSGTTSVSTTSSSTSGSTTGGSSDSTTRLSLGQAIQKLHPGADADAACDRAEHQATRDVQTTTTSTSSSSTSSTSTTSSSTSTPTSSTSTKRHGK